MFKKFAADALGLSDIGKIIPPSDYDKVESDDYVMHEDGEKIFFLIKSKMDEYCFTNRAFIHVDGNSAVSAKRTLKRYEYYKYPISGVMFETAGNMDLDVEIKFYIGDLSMSIDVDKKQIGQLKDLYKTLYTISLIVHENEIKLNDCYDSLNRSMQVVSGGKNEGMNKHGELVEVNRYIYDWINDARKNYVKKDFSDVFLKYIEN
jgi:Bacterial PH domain/YvbH-like oligomerisation region